MLASKAALTGDGENGSAATGLQDPGASSTGTRKRNMDVGESSVQPIHLCG